MKITFLGTNGWYDTNTGNTTCILIETSKEYVILDAGNGIAKIDKYIKTKKPIYLFLSHFHLDHIIGLHILNKFNFPQGIAIYGQEGTRKTLDLVVNKPFTIALDSLPYQVEVRELSQGLHKVPFPIECRFLLHSSRCLGYRLELEKKTICYCTDTGVCDNMFHLAKEADLLISECAYKKPGHDNEWPHLDPISAAEIAKKANVEQLALMHFDAGIYATLDDRKEAQMAAAKVFSNTFAAYDGQCIEL